MDYTKEYMTEYIRTKKEDLDRVFDLVEYIDKLVSQTNTDFSTVYEEVSGLKVNLGEIIDDFTNLLINLDEEDDYDEDLFENSADNSIKKDVEQNKKKIEENSDKIKELIQAFNKTASIVDDLAVIPSMNRDPQAGRV